MDDFLESFYGSWFQHLPDEIICGAIEEVTNEHRGLKSRCPRLYDEYIRLQTIRFLLTFTDVGNLTIDLNGEKVALKSLASSGGVAYVKKDTIDSSISRENFKPVLPEGMELSDFPYGRIKARIEHIEKACSSFWLTNTGFNTGVSNCGMGQGSLSANAATYRKNQCS